MAKGKFKQGKYQVQNPEKYIGNGPPIYRSSWEANFMRTLDLHPAVAQWASEPIKIPYQNPITGKGSVYVPDFLIKYMKASGQLVTELIEIKPASQSLQERAKGQRDKVQLAINAAKWEQAGKYCERYGIKFRVLTEDQLFGRKK